MIDLIEVYEHWWAGRSQVMIAASLGIDRKTVRKYLAPAEASGLVPGSVVMTAQDWRPLVAAWFPDLGDSALRQVTWPAIAVHRDYVLAQLKAGVTQATIHQRLADERGLEVSYSSLRRWVAGNLPEEVRRSAVRVWRPAVEAGSEAQIDYGRLGRWVDPLGGRAVTVWAFVMVLACSRFMFVRPVIRMDQEAWTRAHVEAFAFFGGVPARLVYEYVPRNIFRLHALRDAADGQGRAQRGRQPDGVLGEPPPVTDDDAGVVVDEREQVGLPAADPRPVQGVPGPQLVWPLGLEPAEHRRRLDRSAGDLQARAVEVPQQRGLRGGPPGLGPQDPRDLRDRPAWTFPLQRHGQFQDGGVGAGIRGPPGRDQRVEPAAAPPADPPIQMVTGVTHRPAHRVDVLLRGQRPDHPATLPRRQARISSITDQPVTEHPYRPGLLPPDVLLILGRVHRTHP